MQLKEHPWWQAATIYQIYPRSFKDSNGDGVGDLRGITEKVGYLAKLGVDAIWISPFFKSPMKDFGYDIQDYCEVDPLFGQMSDFDDLLNAYHDHGIKVILDLALSHTSDQHDWFQKSRKSLDGKENWYVWAEGKNGGPPNNWLSAFGGSAWSFDEERKQYYYHAFLNSQPDLNFHEEEVQKAILKQCEFWFKKGIDGLRLDVCNNYFHDKKLRDNEIHKDKVIGNVQHTENPYNQQQHVYDKCQPENIDFLWRLRQLCDRYGDVFLMAEIFSDKPIQRMSDYVGGPGPLHSAYSFDLLTNEWYSGQFKKVVSETFQAAPKGWPTWALGNHDIPRLKTRWAADQVEKHKCFLTLAMGLKGSLCLYQGDELGLSDEEVAFEDMQDPFGKKFYPDYKGRDGCRLPMPWNGEMGLGFSQGNPWLPLPENYREISVEVQEQDKNSVLAHVRSLLTWRNANKAFFQYDIDFLWDSEGFVVFNIGDDDARKIIAANFSEETQKFEFGIGVFRVDPLFPGTGQLKGKTIELPANSYGIYDWRSS